MTLSIELMPAPQRAAARHVAESLAAKGHRAWLVGGAVRDLVLGIPPHDADLCSAALPDEVEALFPKTHAVGKAFGTILVLHEGTEVQVTTFRKDGAYSDGRRPDAVEYGTRLEDDARRRDFTCNALYLDPLTDELADPEGGQADLAARRLRCVGQATERFAEDGLRLLRLARFAARYDLAVEASTLEAARASVDSLEGVSAERVLHELERMAAGPRPQRAVGLLDEIGVWARILPGTDATDVARGLEMLGEGSGAAELFALALGPAAEDGAQAALTRLDTLRPSRVLRGEVAELWRLGRAIEAQLARAEVPRSDRIRLVREPAFERAARLWSARFPDHRGLGLALAELQAFAASLAEDERWPAVWITSADLEERGLRPGPHFGAYLHEAESRQLDRTDASRAEALAWLDAELARGE